MSSINTRRSGIQIVGNAMAYPTSKTMRNRRFYKIRISSYLFLTQLTCFTWITSISWTSHLISPPSGGTDFLFFVPVHPWRRKTVISEIGIWAKPWWLRIGLLHSWTGRKSSWKERGKFSKKGRILYRQDIRFHCNTGSSTRMVTLPVLLKMQSPVPNTEPGTMTSTQWICAGGKDREGDKNSSVWVWDTQARVSKIFSRQSHKTKIRIRDL